jgi:hypothetical protein
MAQRPAFESQTLGCYCLAVAAATVFAGCGGGPQFGSVSGRVTLDDQPLAETTVEFQPESGSPSYGVTNDNGDYTLAWSADQPGAQIGKHTVRITSFNEGNRRIPERVPPRYNRQSELVREVRGGSQRIDFELRGK